MKFIYGEENYLISKELKKVKDSIDAEPIFYNDDSLTSDILSEINTFSLFAEKKLIILKNILALSKDSESEELINDLKNINENNTMIVFVVDGKINKKNKLVEFLLQNAKVIECKQISDKDVLSKIQEIVKAKGGTITVSASIALANKLPNNLRIIIQEIEKLLLESNNIEKEQVENSIGEYLIENYFALSNALVTNNPSQIMRAYKEKLDQGEEAISIISQIASTFNIAYKVIVYQNKGYSSQDIANDLGVHIFRIKKTLEIINTTSEENIKRIIVMLSDLDKNIKNGSIEPQIGMDNFMLNLIK